MFRGVVELIERKKRRYSLVCFVINVVTAMSPFPYSTQMCVPKFSISATYDLGSTLQKIGMRDAFAESANFPGITRDNGLKLSYVS